MALLAGEVHTVVIEEGRVLVEDRGVFWLIGGVLLLFMVSSVGQAQEEWSFRGTAGIGIPAGDLADAADIGPAFGASVGYWFNSRFALELGGQVELLSGGDYDAPGQIGREAPEVTLWHYGLNGRLRLVDASQSTWSFELDGGVGATTFDSDFRIVVNPETDELVSQVSATYLSGYGGLALSYAVSPQLDVFAEGRTYAVFADEGDMGAFTGLSEGIVEPFGAAISLPVSLGINYSW